MRRLPTSVLRTAASRPWFIILIVLLFVGVGLFVYYRLRLAGPGRPHEPEGPVTETHPVTGAELFANHCAGCHGDKGDGNGPAARFLYPRPRHFGEGQFRLVSTLNRIPTDTDLFQVITRGMPGSAMFPFAHLSESDRKALVAHIRQLRVAWVEDQLRRKAAEKGEDLDADELAEKVKKQTVPSDFLAVPGDLPVSEAESVARGGKVYQTVCAACHGVTGKGDGAQAQVDDSGIPTRPRDFTRGIFKGGREREQLYDRIRLGMPGTPMPENPQTPPRDIGDLVNFVLSLSRPEASRPFEHHRTRVVAARAPGPLTDAIPDATWQGAPAASVVVSPLWWRDYVPPDLEVRALHDGQSLAFRLTWLDETPNDAAIRPQDFEDMAAVQLFKGSPEPFLGMGATDRPVDVWLWHPSGQSRPGDYPDVDTAYPHMAVDFYPFEKPGNQRRPHAPEDQAREFITARAAGNLRSDPERNFTASSLRAKGPGSATMRPRLSQVVSAAGSWKDGRWTVVLRRPLQVDADAGVPLAAGERLSIAFALWDGATRDRNGQKLVSIWHDLSLE
jgi:cytochrome c